MSKATFLSDSSTRFWGAAAVPFSNVNVPPPPQLKWSFVPILIHWARLCVTRTSPEKLLFVAVNQYPPLSGTVIVPLPQSGPLKTLTLCSSVLPAGLKFTVAPSSTVMPMRASNDTPLQRGWRPLPAPQIVTWFVRASGGTGPRPPSLLKRTPAPSSMRMRPVNVQFVPITCEDGPRKTTPRGVSFGPSHRLSTARHTVSVYVT